MTAVSRSLPREVLVTGGTGYLGKALISELIHRGHRVRALVRPGRDHGLPEPVEIVFGNPLQSDDVARALNGCDTLVHLVGVPKPSPAKAAQFRSVDLVSIHASVEAALRTDPPPHVVYLSVAQPAPVMKAYVAVRTEGETLLRQRGLQATFLRPWYVLGPGHHWPRVLLPVYWILERFAATRPSAVRLGFVTLKEMTSALVAAVETPPVVSPRILETLEIRACRRQLQSSEHRSFE